MARKKTELTNDDLIKLSEKADDFANEIETAMAGLSFMTTYTLPVERVQAFNRVAEVIAKANRMLLAMEVHQQMNKSLTKSAA